MDNVKVLLANRPRMLRQSLRAVLERHAGIEVETVEPDPVEILSAVDRTSADVVIVTLPESGEAPGITSHLLAQYPQLLVVALSAVEQHAAIFRQLIVREELSSFEEDQLVAAILRRREEKPGPAERPSGDRREGFPRKER